MIIKSQLIYYTGDVFHWKVEECDHCQKNVETENPFFLSPFFSLTIDGLCVCVCVCVCDAFIKYSLLVISLTGFFPSTFLQVINL